MGDFIAGVPLPFRDDRLISKSRVVERLETLAAAHRTALFYGTGFGCYGYHISP